jgi:hypothetical protein
MFCHRKLRARGGPVQQVYCRSIGVTLWLRFESQVFLNPPAALFIRQASRRRLGVDGRLNLIGMVSKRWIGWTPAASTEERRSEGGNAELVVSDVVTHS